jgi:hypothetical protein
VSVDAVTARDRTGASQPKPEMSPHNGAVRLVQMGRGFRVRTQPCSGSSRALEGKVPTFANLHDLIRRTGLAVFLPE